jgi:hypothetical protein
MYSTHKTKSNTLFVGYLDQIHIHAEISLARPVELDGKKWLVSEDLAGETWPVRAGTQDCQSMLRKRNTFPAKPQRQGIPLRVDIGKTGIAWHETSLGMSDVFEASGTGDFSFRDIE